MESYKSEGRASRAHRCPSSPMRLLRFAFVFVIAGLSLSAARGVLNANARETSSPHPDDSVSAFLGRWDLTLKAPDREYPSWLELSQEHGQLKAQMVGNDSIKIRGSQSIPFKQRDHLLILRGIELPVGLKLCQTSFGVTNLFC